MNSEVEQRIVAMYFDNKDFEKNAKQTIDTLGELKDSLDLKDAVKGFDELDKAGRKLNLNQARTNVRNMKDTLAGLSSVLQKSLNIGTAPFRALDNFFSTLRGYAAKFIGFDLGMKFASSLENAIRQLTIAPVEAGWNMYQQNIDSTKTIMSGTLQSYKDQMSKTSSDWTYNEAEHMEYVKGQLKELSEYAQKTVFSLSDMTSNVGKFTNQGVELETAVTAMEGIANMTAKAGQGAQQASMAMYNFSQALGVGKMTSMDWKSIENANLATTELKQLFIDTAVAAGKLQEEVSEDSSGKKIKKFFITVDEEGKKLAKEKWIEVSAENFREQLSKGWLDKETMLRVFQIYSNQVTDLDTLAAWGFDINDKEMMDYLFSIGREAELAATQVRTFQKMWDAMTESVQSGWADSMQYIFGDMREATDFWSTVNDKISEVLDGSAQRRNDLLREWRGMRFDEETKTWKKVIGAVDGREDLVQGIYGAIDALKNLGSAFSNAWGDVFGQLTGKRLQEITRGFRDLVNRFKDWLGDADDANSRISKIRSGLSGIFSIVKIAWESIKGITRFAWKLVKPIIDPMLNLFDKFGKFMKLDKVKGLGDILKTLRDRFTGLWDSLTKIGWGGVFNKIGEWLGGIWDQVWNGISGFLNDIGLEGVKDWFVNLGVKIREGYEAVKKWWNESDLKATFDSIFEAVVGVFRNETDEYGNDIGSPISRFFNSIKGGIEKAFKGIADWWNDDNNPIKVFFAGIFESVVGIFRNEKDEYGNDIGSPIYRFFNSIKGGIENAYNSVAKWWNSGDNPIRKFFGDLFESIAGIFRNETDAEGNDISSPIARFFNSIKGGIDKAYNGIANWWNDANNPVKTFFAGIFESVVGIFRNETDAEGNDIGSPIARFFNSIKGGIESAYRAIAEWWVAEDNPIRTFFSGLYSDVTKLFEPQQREDGSVSTPISDFFWNIKNGVEEAWKKITEWEGWEAIGKFFGDLWGEVEKRANVTIKWFTEPVDDGKTGFIKFLESFYGKLVDIWGKITGWEGWPAIGKFFSDVWGYVASFIGGGNSDAAKVADDGTVKKTEETAQVTQDQVSLLKQIIGAITDFVTKAFDSINGIVLPPAVQKVLTNMFDFLNGLITFVSNIFGSVGRLLGGNASDSDKVIAGLLGVVAIFAEWVRYKNLKNLSNIASSGYMDTMSTKFFHIAMGLLAISAAISLLTTVDTGKMWSAVGAIAVLGAVISVIMNFMTTMNMTSITRSETPVNGIERFFTNLVNVLGKAGMLYIALKLLPDVIKAFGEAKKMVPELEGLDILHTMLGLAALIGGISLSLALVNKISGNMGIDPAAALKTAISVVTFIGTIALGFLGAGGIFELIDGIADKIAGKDVDTTGAIAGALGKVAEFVKGIGNVFNAFVTGLFGIKTDAEKQNAAMDNLNALADNADKFNFETTSGIMRILNMIAELSKVTKDLDTSKMSTFENDMEQVARGVLKFSWIFDGLDDIEGIGAKDSDRFKNFQGAIDLVKQLLDAFSGMKGFGTMGYQSTFFSQIEQFIAFSNNDQMVKDFVAGVNRIIKSMDGLNDGSNVNFDGISIIKKMYEAIQTSLNDPEVDLPEFNALPIVDDLTTTILQSLGYGSSAISLAVHKMVQAGIDKSGKGGNGSGYKFNESEMTGFLDFLNNPENGLGQGTMNTDELTKWLYGEGGSAENPSADSPLGLLGGFKDKMDSFEFPDMSGKLADSFSMKDEKGEDMDLVGELRNTLNTFQDEINKMPEFEIKIIPIIDLKNLNAETLRTQLANYPIGMPINADMAGGMMRLDFSGLNSAIDMTGLQNKIGEVTSAVNAGQFAIVRAVQSMEGRLDGLSAAISGLRLYLDTGMLVGGITPLIDAELGRRADFAQESGVASMLANPYSRTKMIEMEY